VENEAFEQVILEFGLDPGKTDVIFTPRYMPELQPVEKVWGYWEYWAKQ
jgi:transposase